MLLQALALGRDLALLALLGGDWYANTCSNAARNGDLVMLQWARANGCEWDYFTCMEAERGGHLAVLEWARANGCPDD